VCLTEPESCYGGLKLWLEELLPNEINTELGNSKIAVNATDI